MTPRRPGRALVALLGVLALLLVVTACGGDKGSPKSGASPTKGSSGASAQGSDAPAPDPGYAAPKVGDCSRMTAPQTLASVAAPSRVSCRKPHTTVVVYVGYARKAISPLTPVATRRTLAKRVCEPAFRAYAGGTLADRATSLLTWTMFTPGQAALERGARWVRCDILARSGNGLAPLPSTKPLLKSGVPEQLRVCQDKRGVDVSCGQAHAYRLEAVFRAPLPRYPGVSAVVARDRCRQLMGAYGGFVQLPSRAGWTAGDRFVRCLGPTLDAPTASPSP
jgi:hypothetical protein